MRHEYNLAFVAEFIVCICEKQADNKISRVMGYTHWSVGWLVGWSIGWLVGQSSGWLVNPLAC